MQKTIKNINTEFKNKLNNIYSNAEIEQLLYFAHEKVTRLSRITLLTQPDKELSAIQFQELNVILEKLANHEPIQYILGETEFYGLVFKVNPSVLIPRPETEELVHWILNNTPNPNSRILDIGTGSGCIAISLSKNLPKAQVFAADISSNALEMASANALVNNASVKFIETNILTATPDLLPGNMDIIVSNPPYVRESEKKLMQPNVLNHEPEQALFVPNSDPLIFYMAIAKISTKLLRKGGCLYFEINEAFANEVCTILSELNYNNIEVKRDINDKNRMIYAQK